VGADDVLGEGDGGSGVGDLDDEADWAETFFHVLGFIVGVAGEKHRGADFGLREFRVVELGRGQDDLAQLARTGFLDALQSIGRLDGAEHGMGDFRLGQEAGDGHRQVGTDVIVRLVSFVGGYAASRDQDGLRGRAHLAGVERQREGQVAEHLLIAVGRVNDDVVYAGQLGIDLGLAAVVDQPLAEDVATGEVDRLDGLVGDQLLRRFALVGDAQADQVGVNAVLGEHGADGADGDRGRQDGVAVRLGDHRVAGGQGGEQAGIGVPGRESAAADDDADATADDLEVLLHDQRRILALRLFPGRFAGHELLLAVGVGNGFEAAILGVRGAGLEGHHPALAGGHHDRVGEFEALLVQAAQDFQAEAGAAVGAGGLPANHGLFASGDQGLDVADRVLHVEVDTVGRLLAAHPATLAGLVEDELLAKVGFVGFLAIIRRRFAIDLGTRHFIEGRPVAAGMDGVERAVERGAVLLE